MADLPAGVVAFDRAEALEQVWKNMVGAIFGGPKAGKTHFMVRSQGPRYVVYADPNGLATLKFQILKAAQEEKDGKQLWPDENVFYQYLAPIEYDLLTDDEAERRVRQVLDFAKWAKQHAREEVRAGRPGGTFLFDGMVMFKGYVEKWKLGESATLGFRPKRGQKTNISTYDYAVPNTFLKEFVAGFGNQDLNAVFCWEGRPDYLEVRDPETGRNKSVRQDTFHTSMPDSSGFAVNFVVEPVRVKKDVVVENRIVGKRIVNMLRIGYNAFDSSLENLVVPVNGFDELRELFLGGLGEMDAKPAEAYERVGGEEL